MQWPISLLEIPTNTLRPLASQVQAMRKLWSVRKTREGETSTLRNLRGVFCLNPILPRIYEVAVCRAWLLSKPSDHTADHSQSVKVLIYSSEFAFLLLTFHLSGVKGDIMNQICKKLHSLFSTTLFLRMLTIPGIFSHIQMRHTCRGLRFPPKKMGWLKNVHFCTKINTYLCTKFTMTDMS